MKLKSQKGRDLGLRMHNAIRDCLKRYENVLLTGADVPELDLDALALLAGKTSLKDKVVLMPADDGGYVLIGMGRHKIELFLNMKWSREDVYKNTIKRLKKKGTGYRESGMQQDVDTMEDLKRLRRKGIVRG